MQDSLPECRSTADDVNMPTFLARKGVMLREYHVVVLWPDGRREKVGRFPRKPDAARWIEEKSADWLAQYFARADDARIGIDAMDNGASPSPA